MRVMNLCGSRSGTLSVDNGGNYVASTAQWLATPSSVAFSSLSSALQSIVTALNSSSAQISIQQLTSSASLFVVRDATFAPFVSHMGSGSTSSTPFSCTVGDELAVTATYQVRFLPFTVCRSSRLLLSAPHCSQRVSIPYVIIVE